MNRRLALVALLVLGGVSTAEDKPAWEQLSDEDGIKVWRREVEGSPVVAVKGEATIATPIAKLASVLHDTSRAKEWVCSLGEARVLKVVSPTVWIEYNRLEAPWPVSDRDFVFRTEIKLDKKQKSVTFELKSVEEPSCPPNEDKAVRGELVASTYQLQALEDGRTRVTVEIQVDPKGSLPKWLVNWAQKGWPRATLENIRDQIAKPDVQELALVKDGLAETAVVTTSVTK
ncbi:MAG TPA: START domain-containing protein [Planctomycetota bacterium]|nr:START domain-containing protein [Planctomycetota bacterium]